MSCRGLDTQIASAQQVMLGNPAAAILDGAGNEQTILIATHGRSGTARWTLGSVADCVAHRPQAAVLLVRASAAEAHEPLATATTEQGRME